MSAVWRAARAAVRRRRLQTYVIGLVVLLSTATVVLALALLDASSAPFDRAFAAQRGAHVVATFAPGSAPAGGFRQVTVEPERSDSPFARGPMRLVGRADPGGPVDRLDLWLGRWPTGPGEVVLNEPPAPDGMRTAMFTEVPPIVVGGVRLTVVGWAHSLSDTADGWVTPAQLDALGPTAVQVLYRFDGDVSTRAALDARMAGLSPIATQTYLDVKEQAAESPGTYLPFLTTFGILGLLVAILIVANVVNGAVVAGYRHIGILKALGFTPRQVLAVYLVMVSVPAVAGCLLGAVVGGLAARPLLADSFRGLGFGDEIAVRPWVWTVALLGVPALVLLAALAPALRARRLPAARAISAGSAPQRGRGLRIQRRLGGSRLPRPVSLGLGLPFARPGRTALTLAALLLGVTTVTFATGLAASLNRYATLTAEVGGEVGVRGRANDVQVEGLLRGLGAAQVGVVVGRDVPVTGQSRPLLVNFARADVPAMGYADQLLAGRWMAGPAEAVAPSELLGERGLAVGDRVTLESGGRRTTLTIVGETIAGVQGPPGLFADWAVLATLGITPTDFYYQVRLPAGADPAAFRAAVEAADPTLHTWDNTGTGSFQAVVVGISATLALLLATVAALGVLNTVALNVRERRRDLGMLKSIGMTPRQVVTMVVSSMAALGVVGGVAGIPLGMAAHRVILPLTAAAADVRLPGSVLRVWPPGVLGLLVLSGVAIAVIGALPPARSAARLTIARVLHNE